MRKPWAGRVVLLVLALLWAWVGWAFFWQHYARINTAAPYFALAWWGQAVLLAAGAMFGLAPGVVPRLMRYAGIAASVAGVVSYSVQPQAFGLMPGPTALATAGLLFMLRPRAGAVLLVLAVMAWLAEALTTLVIRSAH